MIKVNGIEIEQKHFPDKTLLIKVDPNLLTTPRIEISWIYENDAELFTLICVKRHLETWFDSNCFELALPYVPHARMDRVQETNDVFTLKYFCEVINSLNFRKVWTLDVHSNVALALLNNVVEEKPFYQIDCVRQRLADVTDSLVMFYPDEGSMKRYSNMFAEPCSFGVKKRDWTTGKIEGLTLVNPENVRDKNVLIIDDICSKGGTFYHSAKALKEAGAKDIYLYVSHLEDTVFKGELIESDLIKKIFTSAHSIYSTKQSHEKIILI